MGVCGLSCYRQYCKQCVPPALRFLLEVSESVQVLHVGFGSVGYLQSWLWVKGILVWKVE